MTTEITIFDIPEQEIVINKSQKEIEYDNLKRLSKLPSYHFDSFYDIELREEKHDIPQSNIVSILCKYVIKYCQPVMNSDDNGFKITLQNERITKIYDLSTNLYYSIPSNEQFNIVGIQLPYIFVNEYDKYMLSSFDHITNDDMANTGFYGLYDHQTNKFTAQKPGFNKPGDPYIETIDNNIVLFRNENDANTKLKLLIDYIQYIEKYYAENYLTLVTDITFDYKPEFVNDGRTNWKIERDTNDTDVLKSLKKGYNGSLDNAFDSGLYLTLQKNDLIKAYNVGKKIGITSPVFKTELNIKKEKIEYQIDFEQQKQLNLEKQLETSKKRTIAYKKYKEMDLTKLDKKQLNVINLEYEKMQKTMNKKISIAGQENQKLWSNLRKSFLEIKDVKLRKVLQEIEKQISNKQLNSKELIEGGVCPHVYHQGKTMLKDFSKPWMSENIRKELINNFSLPESTAGYFCSICGEFLSEADNERVVRFVAGEKVQNNITDDPIKSMIWKEAMYTISTYVRFNTMIPIKPLVGSITNGLRDIIAQHETKLYRSRTNNADSIKDTLNLYSSIYIYAVLCAMMITNPNKMMFGRDKSEDINKLKDRRDKQQDKTIKDKTFEDKQQDDNIQPPPLSEFVDHETPEDLAKNIQDEDLKEPVLPTIKEQSMIGAGEKRNKKSKIKTYVGGKTTKDIKLYERFILTTSLNLILVTKEPIIKRLTYMNIDVVKQLFLKTAYPWAKQHARPIKVSDDTIHTIDQKQNIIYMNPFYNYLYYAKRLAYNSGSEKRYPSDINDVKSILGRTIDEISEDMKIYSNTHIPAKWDFGDKYYDDYTYLSFLSVYKYLSDELFLKNFVPRHAQVEKYYEDQKEMKKMEKLYLIELNKQKVRPMFQIEMLNDLTTKYSDFSPEKLDLAKFYCPNGQRHIIGNYIYKTKNKEEELDPNILDKWVKNNDVENLAKYADYKLVNERCKLCKKLIRTETSSDKTENTLQKKFGLLDDINAFYQYYTSRCPVNGLHDIIDHKCTKCKLDTKSDRTSADAYYNKYVDIFKKIEREKLSITIDSLDQATEENKHSKEFVKKIVIDQKVEYKYTLHKVAEWSQIAKKPYNVIVNIGLSENIKYIDILNANANPSKLDLSNDAYVSQSLKLKNYIRSTLRDYNMLMNHEQIAELPLYLKNILNTQKKKDLSKMTKQMPQFINEFTELDNKYKYKLNPKNYANFLIEYLANIFVTLYEKTSSDYKLASNMFIKHYTDLIIEQERLHSKAEYVVNKKQKDDVKEEDNVSSDNVSGDDYLNRQTDVSEPEFSLSEKDEDYKADDIDDFSDAYDVENAADIWDIE